MHAPHVETPELRLLIIDDRRLIREGLLALFAASDGFLALPGGFAEMVWLCKRFTPDLALMGISVPERISLQTARSVLSLGTPPRVVFLDDAVHPTHVWAARALGADGYWTMSASFLQLAEGVRTAVAGRPSFCPAARRHLRVVSNGRALPPPPVRASRLSQLTRRETEVLILLAQGLRVRECAQRLNLAYSTVDNHKSRLMRKLGIDRVADLVRLAIREGLVDEQ
ncbi:MAG: response regulator transcription factor [Pirellulales bacterium]|nr:response regulator transcription factor [Pirellulales bacterium]